MDREAQLEALQQKKYDVLVIGGGATGAGVALDAATRGLEVALLEKTDFSAGTSSRSTKLIHGGVRYLEKAVKQLDRTQFNLVRDALKERAVLINIAPHLAKPLPIVTPLYNILEVPYFMTGLKLYDALAGKANLSPSRFVDTKEALNRFPMLKEEGLRGAVIYYDGQFDDARMNLAIIQTAVAEGANVANHVTVTKLSKDDGNINGVEVQDNLTGATWQISAKVVVNATGPYTDSIRHMDDPDAAPMLQASSGVHIMLDKRFSPPETGLLIPETEDGRVLFLLPWLDHTLVGTTDTPAQIVAHPKAEADEVAYILRHLHQYFSVPVTEADVLAKWSGLRPLVSDPAASDTAALSRDHIINTSPSNLVTIAGGKWTTYRKMALDTIDEAIKVGKLMPDRASQTETLKLVGAKKYRSSLSAKLQDKYKLDKDIISYITRAYGDKAEAVLTITKNIERINPRHAFLTNEIVYAAKHEAARTISDFLARRIRLGFLEQQATLEAIPVVGQVLAEILDWNEAYLQAQIEEARVYFS